MIFFRTKSYYGDGQAHVNRFDELEREDFTRLKLVQGKKVQEEVAQAKRKAEFDKETTSHAHDHAPGKENEQDITAEFDANDDEEVVF